MASLKRPSSKDGVRFVLGGISYFAGKWPLLLRSFPAVDKERDLIGILLAKVPTVGKVKVARQRG